MPLKEHAHFSVWFRLSFFCETNCNKINSQGHALKKSKSGQNPVGLMAGKADSFVWTDDEVEVLIEDYYNRV